MEGTLTFINEKIGRPEVGECIFDVESKLLVMELLSQPLPLCLLLDAPEAHMVRLAVTGDVSFAIDILQTETLSEESDKLSKSKESPSKEEKVVRSYMFVTRSKEELTRWIEEIRKVARSDCSIVTDPVENQAESPHTRSLSPNLEQKEKGTPRHSSKQKSSGVTVVPPDSVSPRGLNARSPSPNHSQEVRAVDDYLCGLNSKRGSFLKPQERETLGKQMRIIKRMSEIGKIPPQFSCSRLTSASTLYANPLTLTAEGESKEDKQNEAETESRKAEETDGNIDAKEARTGDDASEHRSSPGSKEHSGLSESEPFSPASDCSAQLGTELDSPASSTPTSVVSSDGKDESGPVPLSHAVGERNSHSALALMGSKKTKRKNRKRDCIVITHPIQIDLDDDISGESSAGTSTDSSVIPSPSSAGPQCETLTPPTPELKSASKPPSHSSPLQKGLKPEKGGYSSGSSPMASSASSSSPSSPLGRGRKGDHHLLSTNRPSTPTTPAKMNKKALSRLALFSDEDMASVLNDTSSFASPRKMVFDSKPSKSRSSARVTSVRYELQSRQKNQLVEGLFPVAVPKNIATLIFSFLSPPDLLNAMLVSKRWKEYADTPALWSTFSQTLGLAISVPESDGDKDSPDEKDKRTSSDRRCNFSRLAIQSFRATASKLSRTELVEAFYKRMLWQQLQYKEGSGYSGWLSVRGERLFKKWKRRWAVIWNNCLVMYETRRPDALPLSLLPLTSDVQTQVVRKTLFTITSKNGVLVSYKLSGNGSGNVVEVQRGSIFLDAIHTVEALAWINTVKENAKLSEHLLCHNGISPVVHHIEPKKEEVAPMLPPVSPSKKKKAQAQAPPTPQVFGCALRSISKKGAIPMFLIDIMERLEAKALDEEGLFRLSGSISEVMALKEKIEANGGGHIDVTREDPHTLTAVLKLYFRELPEPLIPPDVNQVINEFLGELDIDSAVARSSDAKTAAALNAIVQAVRYALCQLPACNLAVMHRLIMLLRAVVAHSEKNLMTRDNVFIVLLPTLRCAPNILTLLMTYPDELLAPP